MSETERDGSTGQFTSSSGPIRPRRRGSRARLYAHAGQIRGRGARNFRNGRQGFNSLPEEAPPDPTPIIYYNAKTGEPLNADPSEGEVESITLERGAKDQRLTK